MNRRLVSAVRAGWRSRAARPEPSKASRSTAQRRFRALRPVPPPRQSLFTHAVWRRLAQSLELSERESQIVPALLDGANESAIATHLGISRHTVHTYTERLYRKMGVSSRAGLVRRVFVEYLSLSRRTSVPSAADTLRDDFRASRR